MKLKEQNQNIALLNFVVVTFPLPSFTPLFSFFVIAQKTKKREKFYNFFHKSHAAGNTREDGKVSRNEKVEKNVEDEGRRKKLILFWTKKIEMYFEELSESVGKA